LQFLGIFQNDYLVCRDEFPVITSLTVVIQLTELREILRFMQTSYTTLLCYQASQMALLYDSWRAVGKASLGRNNVKEDKEYGLCKTIISGKILQ
jgi:hypothetical protein